MSFNQQQQLYELLRRSRNPVIVCKANPSGDAISAGLALSKILQKMGKNTDIICPELPAEHVFNFLAGAESIKNNVCGLKKFVISLDAEKIAEPEIKHEISGGRLNIFVDGTKINLLKDDVKIFDSVYKHDLIVALNAPDLESMGALFEENADFFYQTPIINIDHSPENEHYGQLNLINITAISISEIIYEMIEMLDSNFMDESIATCLLAGMIEKTKSFKIPSVTPKTLHIASCLLAAGAEREMIVRKLYQTKTVNSMRLWGRVLLNLQTDENQKIAWAEIKEEEFSATGATEKDLPALIEELIACIPTIELTALFYEKENEKFCLLKSEKNIDLKNIFSNIS
ncbi:hypothetical protein KKA13_04830, partial [Patescibacteria group bacterium]|nr:hypothetical protein [Patescibacteria group bacterium]